MHLSIYFTLKKNGFQILSYSFICKGFIETHFDIYFLNVLPLLVSHIMFYDIFLLLITVH